MSLSVSTAFIRQYERDVHMAYQREGSLLRNTVRTVNGVTGESTTFQKIGTGSASRKPRNGKVEVMAVTRSSVTCTLEDWYAADWVDKLDENKMNYDERQALNKTGAFALGRKTDELILTAMDATTNTVGDYSTALTRALCLEAIEARNSADVPDDMSNFAVLTSRQWGKMMEIDEFANSDYGGSRFPWLKGRESRTWLNTTWMHHSGLPAKGTANAKCFMWHMSGVGHAIGADVQSMITYENPYGSWFVNNMMSQGACLIDANAVVEIRVDDTVAYA